MGMNLGNVLEPLLTTLRQAADDKLRNDTVWDPTNPAAVNEGKNAVKALNNGDLPALVDRFRGYYSLDGHDLDPVADQFATQSDRWAAPTGGSVYCSVAGAAEDVDDVGKLIHSEQWMGQGAESFHHNFLKPFKNTAAAHGACAQEMAIGAKALADGIERAKECVVWICKDAIWRLGGGSEPGPLPGESGEGTGGLVAVLADTVALFNALGEGAGFDVVLAGIGVAGGLIAESKNVKSRGKEKPIDVAESFSTFGIIDNIWTALNALDANIDELDDAIGRGLDKDFDRSGPFGSPYARIENPHLKSSAYRHSEIARGRDDANDVVVTSVVRLYYAGFRTLPAAAEAYDTGVQVCSGAHVTGVQKHFPRAVGKFNEAARTFTGLLRSVRDDLDRSGASIVTAATHYADTDSYEARQIRKLEGEIPPVDVNDHDYVPPPWLEP